MHTSCAASSTSNEENSDPLYDQGEALISKLARLVEEPDLEEASCGGTKKPRFQDNVYPWDKDDVRILLKFIQTSQSKLNLKIEHETNFSFFLRFSTRTPAWTL